MPEISRRRMLQLSAVTLGGGAVGASLITSTGTKATTAETSLAVAGDEVTTRNGDLAAVWLDIATEWAYTVPSGERPETVVIDVLAGESTDDLDVVDTAESDEVFLESSGSETFAIDLLEAGATDSETLVPDEGGETTETTVHVGLEMRLIDESGVTIASDSQTDTATISVERSDYEPDEHGSVGGAGELTVELE